MVAFALNTIFAIDVAIAVALVLAVTIVPTVFVASVILSDNINHLKPNKINQKNTLRPSA